MASCVNLTLTAPLAPSLQFYAATQIPGLALPLTAFEDITGNCFVSLTVNGLVAASSFPVRPAHAYIRQPVVSGASVYAQQDGLLNPMVGLTAGGLYFLTKTGGISLTPPTSGIVQAVGTAAATDGLLVQIEAPVYLA
jgi:hypothetical protein